MLFKIGILAVIMASQLLRNKKMKAHNYLMQSVSTFYSSTTFAFIMHVSVLNWCYVAVNSEILTQKQSA